MLWEIMVRLPVKKNYQKKKTAPQIVTMLRLPCPAARSLTKHLYSHRPLGLAH